jgi:chemotaxis response regulator CheB
VFVKLIGSQPGEIQAAILVFEYILPRERSRMAEPLRRVGSSPAIHAEDGEEIATGKISAAPPNRRMDIKGDYLRPVARSSSFQPPGGGSEALNDLEP